MANEKMPWWVWAGVAGGAAWLFYKSQESSGGSSSTKLPDLTPPPPDNTDGSKLPALPPAPPAEAPPSGLPKGSSTTILPAAYTSNSNYVGSFPKDLAEREKFILDKVRKGDFYVDWSPVTASHNGRNATFFVTSDALKVDGFRVIATPTLQQQIADLLDASLLTPQLADMVFAQAKVRIRPIPRPITSTTESMMVQSQSVDEAIEKAGGKPGELTSTVGKHWVIDNDLLKKPKSAMNYGWHFFGPNIYDQEPLDTHLPVSRIPDGKGGIAHVVQTRGTAHNIFHTDYSQNVSLVSKKVILDDKVVDLATILQSPDLAPLASHQGPLKLLRQPGVPELAPVSADTTV